MISKSKNPEIVSSQVELTHYHTKPHFDALKIFRRGKDCKKGRNRLEQAISSFLKMFSTLYGTYFFILNAL